MRDSGAAFITEDTLTHKRELQVYRKLAYNALAKYYDKCITTAKNTAKEILVIFNSLQHILKLLLH